MGKSRFTVIIQINNITIINDTRKAMLHILTTVNLLLLMPVRCEKLERYNHMCGDLKGSGLLCVTLCQYIYKDRWNENFYRKI